MARIGGDEFAVLVSTDLAPRAVKRRMARLLADLARPIEWRGRGLALGASAGMALAHDPHCYDAEALFCEADAALYAAKHAGRGVAMLGSRARHAAFRSPSTMD